MTEFEKTADECDTAAQLQDHFNQQGRAAISAQLKSEQGADFDGTCVDCGEEMPPVRIAYGRCRCTLCQVAKEKLDKQRAR